MEQILPKLAEVNTKLNRIQDLDVLLERTLTLAREFTNADAGSIYLCDHNDLVIHYTQNDSLTLRSGSKLVYRSIRIPITPKSIAGYVASNRVILNLANVNDIEEFQPYRFDRSYDLKSGYTTVSMLTFPLVSANDDSLIGILQLINARDAEGKFIPFDKIFNDTISFLASTASIAINRARSTRRLLLRMISMAGLRDPRETGAHVNRVGAYSIEVYERWATRVGLNLSEIEKNKDLLRRTAMLHDVGKVAISDLILKKSGRLTEEEYEEMKSHTWRGAQLFANAKDPFEKMAMDVILNHHENWDGSGYPGHIDIINGKETRRGKKSDEISIYAQIVSIADVFDALTSKRAYKSAWTIEESLEEINRLSGTKFNPDLVEIFMECVPYIQNIMSFYPNDEVGSFSVIDDDGDFLSYVD